MCVYTCIFTTSVLNMINMFTFRADKMEDVAIVLDHIDLLNALYGIYSQLLEGVLQVLSIHMQFYALWFSYCIVLQVLSIHMQFYALWFSYCLVEHV